LALTLVLMKKSALILPVLLLFSIGCNYSKGVKKDLVSGLSVNYNGFRLDESYLVGPDDQAVDPGEVPMNSDVSIVIQGIENYELKDGKAYPGLSLKVTDGRGNAVINESDLFSSGEGYSPEDAAILRGTVTVGTPMKSGETYHVLMQVWDKNKKENVINADLDITIK
jgi:hypothetical protein